MRITFLLSLVLVLAKTTFAQHTVKEVLAMQGIPKSYAAAKTSTIFTIDGKDDESIWATTAWTDSFQDIEGHAKAKPKYDTKIKMLWDDENLYIYARLEEPHIWGDLTTHDAIIYHNNDFEVFIKPYNNQSTYFELEVNPLNTILDLLMTKPYRLGGEAMIHWDIKGIQTAVYTSGTINNPNDRDNYWAIEMAIPFQSIHNFGRGSSPKSGDQWRINFSRVQWQHEVINGKYSRKKVNNKYIAEDNWVWSPIGIVNMHYPERWGYIHFIDALDTAVPYPKSQNIEQFTWNLYYLQNIFKNKHNKYCKEIALLQEKHSFWNDEFQRYTIETTLNKDASYYRIAIKDNQNNLSTSIDSYGNYNINYGK